MSSTRARRARTSPAPPPSGTSRTPASPSGRQSATVKRAISFTLAPASQARPQAAAMRRASTGSIARRRGRPGARTPGAAQAAASSRRRMESRSGSGQRMARGCPSRLSRGLRFGEPPARTGRGSAQGPPDSGRRGARGAERAVGAPDGKYFQPFVTENFDGRGPQIRETSDLRHAEIRSVRNGPRGAPPRAKPLEVDDVPWPRRKGPSPKSLPRRRLDRRGGARPSVESPVRRDEGAGS